MKYRREIDGLRALAVIPVMLFHAGFPTFGGGFVGVDVFFVISGYLITSIILVEQQAGTFTLLKFYERRARRILPALLTVLVACIPFAWMWLLPNDMKLFSQSLVAVCTFSSNFLFWRQTGYFDTAAELKPLLHTWSLAVEEQYYLLFPLFLMLAARIRRPNVLAILLAMGLVSFGLAEWGAYNQPAATFFLLPTRGWELLIGALTAFYLAEPNRRVVGPLVSHAAGAIGLMLIIYAVFAFNQATPFPSAYALAPTVGAALIILFTTPASFVGRVLASGPCVGLGLISYSAYLWHQPLLVFARLRSTNEPSRLMSLILVMAAVALAYFSWKYIESPFRNKRLYSATRIFILGAAVSLALVAFGLVGINTGGFASRLDSESLRLLNPPGLLSFDSTTECHRDGSSFAPLNESCVLGEKSRIIGALIGDSHANAIAYELGTNLKKMGVGVLQFTFNGCPPLEGVYRVDVANDDKCTEFNRDAFNYIKNHPELANVIVVARWTRYLKSTGFDNLEGGVEHTERDLVDTVEDGWRQRNAESVRTRKIAGKYATAIQGFLNLGKTVVVVYPVPEVGWNVPDFLVKQRLFSGEVGVSSTSFGTFLDRNMPAYAALDTIGQHENLARVYPEKVLCNTYVLNRCIFELNNEPLYVDRNHLSNAGAQLIVEEVVKALRR